MGILDNFLPEDADTRNSLGSGLGALGLALASSPNNAPFQNLPQAFAIMGQQQKSGMTKSALKALLMQAGYTDAEADKLSSSEGVAKMAIQQKQQQKLLSDDGEPPAIGSLPSAGAVPSMSPAAPAGPAAGVSLNGDKSDKAKAVYDGLIQRGLSPVLAAGMTGNIDAESGFNPGAVGDKGTAFGYHQVRADRYDNLNAIAKARGVAWNDHDAQLDNIAAEFNGKDGGMLKARRLIEADPNMTPEKAAAIIAQYGERPAASALAESLPRRTGTAAMVYSRFGQGSAPTQVADASGGVPTVPVARAPLGAPRVQTANSEQETQALESRMGMYPSNVYGVTPETQQGGGTGAVAQASPADLPASGAQEAAFFIPPGAAEAIEKKVGAAPPPVNDAIGPQTQRAQALRQFEYWGRRLRASGALGEAGKGLAEEAKIKMGLAQKYLEPTEFDKLSEKAGLSGDDLRSAARAALPDSRTPAEKETGYLLANPQNKDTFFEVKRAGAQTEADPFAKEAEKLNATRLGAMRDAGDKSQAAVGDFQRLRQLSAIVGDPGQGAVVQKALGPYMTALGIDSKGLEPLQQYNSVIQKLAPQMHVAGSGAQSDIEFKGALSALGDPTMTSGARAAIIDGLEATHRYNIARAEIADAALNKEITAAEASKRMRAMPNPLQGFNDYKKAHPEEFPGGVDRASAAPGSMGGAPRGSAPAPQPTADQMNATDRAVTIRRAKEAIQKNPAIRDAVLQRLRDANLPTDGF
jgi:hypothetical protein